MADTDLLLPHEDPEQPLPSPSACDKAQQTQQPPPYSPAPPPYAAQPSPSPHFPAPEPGFTGGYQSTSAEYPVGESDGPVVSGFDDKTIRQAFIRKVFCVVTVQLVFTFSVVCVFTFSSAVQDAVLKNIWIFYSSLIVYLVSAMCLICCRSLSRLHPWNLVALGVITVSLSYMVGTVASMYNTPAVIIAMGSTLAISVGVIAFSAQTKVDFTVCNGLLFALALNVVMLGFFSIFFYSKMLQVFYGFLGAILFSMFLVVDCQLVMGRATYALSPEEHVFAALNIYLDMINIFLYILMIFGGGRK
ncbi:protein lifeguard 1 isoform X1 [Engraulis encrasicolus]|uniref:protein lifeguard 1 isoform X1 n=1 Tax=Engraulis encrasicolus TaxID=184585 RepID=UPI002FD6F8A2